MTVAQAASWTTNGGVHTAVKQTIGEIARVSQTSITSFSMSYSSGNPRILSGAQNSSGSSQIQATAVYEIGFDSFQRARANDVRTRVSSLNTADVTNTLNRQLRQQNVLTVISVLSIQTPTVKYIQTDTSGTCKELISIAALVSVIAISLHHGK